MPLESNSTNDSLHMASVTTFSGTPSLTLAVICRRTGNARDGLGGAYPVNVWNADFSSAAVLSIADTNAVTLINNTGASTGTLTHNTTEGWVLLAFSRPAGTTQTVRAHKYVYGTDTWTHTDDGTFSDDASLSSPNVDVFSFNGAAVFNGQIEAAGIWNRVLTDLEVEDLAYSWEGWVGSNPDWYVQLDIGVLTDTVANLGTLRGSTTKTALAVSTVPSPLPTMGGEPLQIMRFTALFTQAVSGSMPAASGTIARLVTYLRTLTGAMPAASGTVARLITYVRSLAGSMPAPSGTIAALTYYFRTLTGNMPAASGTVARLTTYLRTLTGNMPNATGVLTEFAIRFQSLAGNMPAATGVVTGVALLLKSLAGAMPAATGAVTTVLTIAQSLAGNMPNPVGVVGRQVLYLRTLVGNMPNATGTLTEVATFLKTLTGNMPNATGVLSSLRNITLLGNMAAAAGTLATSYIPGVGLLSNYWMKLRRKRTIQ